MQHLLDFVLDVTKSVAHHGFRRILIADGHGSNMPILDLVARRTILETEALCAPFLWPSLALKEIRQLRESGRGGMSHACELETSVYLYLDADRVQMDKARKETGQPPSDFMLERSDRSRSYSHDGLLDKIFEIGNQWRPHACHRKRRAALFSKR